MLQIQFRLRTELNLDLGFKLICVPAAPKGGRAVVLPAEVLPIEKLKSNLHL